jgi:hypothetical protein
MMDVIPLDATLVRGSHGLAPSDPREGAMLASSDVGLLEAAEASPTDICELILRHVDLPCSSPVSAVRRPGA